VEPVVIYRNGFVDSALARAPDGSRMTGMTPEWTREWARKKAEELNTTVEDHTKPPGTSDE
jgi:hypothetical protein